MLRSRIYGFGAFLAAVGPVLGMPWIVTSYYAQLQNTIAPKEVIGGKTFSADIFTNTAAISLTKFPVPSAISTATSIDKVDDLTIVSILLPSAAGKTIDLFPSLSFNNYYVALTFTAPSRCPSPHWTHTTSALAFVPYQVTPTPIATLKHETWQAGTDVNFLIDATDLPSSSLSKLSSEMAPIWSDSCVIPDFATATGIPTGPLSGGNSGFSDCLPFELLFGGKAIGGGYQCDDGEHWTWGTTLAGLICAWIFSFLGFFLICGLIESFFSFRSLSRGKTARRGIPISWAFMFPLLSCFFLLGVNRGYVAKPLEEQQRLQVRWDNLGFGTKLGQWLSWGFRWGYPPFLGPEPPRKGAHYHPSNNYYSAQGGPGPGGPPPPMGQQQQQYAPQGGQRPTSDYLQQFQHHPYQPPTGAYQQPGSPYYYDARSPGSASQNTSPQPVQHSPYSPPPQYGMSKGSPVQEHTTPVSPNRSSMGTSATATAPALAPGVPPTAPALHSHPPTSPRNPQDGPAELQ